MSIDPAACGAAFSLAAVSPISFADPLAIPYGDILSGALGYISTILLAIIMWAMRFLPAQLYSLLMTMRVEQLLAKAVSFGANAVAGATKDKVLSVEIGNKVLREAVSYALDHGGPLLLRFMGTPAEVAEKVWARLDVAPEVTKPNFAVIAEVAQS